MNRPIHDSVVIITGASAGIGLALAEALAARGAQLVLCARRLDRLEVLNQKLGGGHLPLQIDVSQPADCQRLIESAVTRFGRIDTLVCNAGYGFLKRVTDTPVAEIEAIFRTNVLGTIECIRHAVPLMKRQAVQAGVRGQVMVVSSAVARRAIPLFGVYAATKAAQLSLCEALRVELASDQIAVTSVHPVGTETEFWDVSASRSLGKKPAAKGEPRQSAATVAKAMVRAIEHPRPEVWPMPVARWGTTLATLVPALADRILRKRLSGSD